MLPNGVNQGFNPYPTYPTYFPQQPVQLPQAQQYTPNRTTQPIPSQQIANISGRVVQNEQEITPQEVPMDGSISLFPLGDYSTIIAKQWNSDGTIKTLRFVPEVVTAQSDISQEQTFIDHFDERMDELMKAVKNRGHYNKQQNYRPKPAQKEEVDSNA